MGKVLHGLVDAIRNKGLKKHFVAEQVNISPRRLSEIINGHKQPHPSEAKALAKALGIKQAQLFGFEYPEHVGDT